MVAVENNGNALSCIILMLDSLASTNNAFVTVETQHGKGCTIFKYLKKKAISNKNLSELDPVSREALKHLYSCNCDAEIEAIFSSREGDTLLIPLNLPDIKKQYPWLEDDESMQEVLDAVMEHGTDSPLLNEKFKSTALELKKSLGHPGVPEKEVTDKVIEFSGWDPESL